MNKLKMHTPDGTRDNIARIGELFPNCITEAKDEKGNITRAIDFDQLRQELSDSIVEGPRERYHLDWPGKREALLAANAPIAKTLRPAREESVEFGTTRNLFIEGDNLEALKLLQETYLNKVKLIYIDPPYNTGNDFIYKDDFSQSTRSYLERSNQTGEGGRLVANAESNGRFHSDWLSMIYPRLFLARNLLRDDGAIFISIDETEQPNLRKLCDEIFGEENFVADMVWAAGRKNDSKYVSVSHEYILVYVRDMEYLKQHAILWRQRKEGLDEIYGTYQKLRKRFGADHKAVEAGLKEWFAGLADTNPAKAHRHYSSVDARGIYFPADISWPGGGGPKYQVLHPKTGKPVRVPSRGWMTSDPTKMRQWIKDDRVHFGDTEDAVPCIKSYLADREVEVPYSVFYQDGRAATKRLREIFGADVFENPKDELILKKVIEFAADKDSIVLDFFAGSCTTAHAVLELNKQDGGNRKFIAAQLPEICEENSEAYRAGYKDIAEIGKERIRRAGKKIKEEMGLNGIKLDIGFRVLKVDTSNMKDVYYQPDAVKQETLHGQVDNIKNDRSDEDLLFQVLLDWGVDLTLPIKSEKIEGKNVYFVDTNALAACFEPGIDEAFIKELAKRKPLRAVFRDNGYGSDATKINVEQIFKLSSPGTEVKAI